jgi:DNA topoisomerase I
MSNKLVIIEAPGKVKAYKKYLPDNYSVIATAGHVFDLPEKGLNVNIKKDFEADFQVIPDKKDIFAKIVKEAKKADEIIIMTDPDREGSGIGWNIYQNLPNNKKVKRAKTQSINKKSINEALSSAYDFETEKSLVDAFFTRRILDRIVGYKTSFLVKRATGGRSAGRTQSAGLRILSARENEIQAFIPEEYWPISIELLTDKYEKILANIKKPSERDIKTEKDAKTIVDAVKGKQADVIKFDKKESKTRASAPFTTSSMYQSAAGILKWKSDKTAKVAQKLYEAGVITYHRTDSLFMVPEFVSEIRDHISDKYSTEYLPAKPNHFGNPKNAQEAHEACRVTDLSAKEYTHGMPEENTLYKLIWKRTVASQMTDMRKLGISAEFEVASYIFSATGSKLLFEGWRKVWDYGDVSDTELPELEVGEQLKVIDIKTEQKFTQPPSRYTERSFLKKLEQEGIGRPSTYASIIKTLGSRGYIDNKKAISVSPLGLKVDNFMISVPFCFAEIGFSAEMEKSLDDILQKTQSKKDVLTKFWKRLKDDIDKSKDIKSKQILTSHICPKCKENGIKAFLAKKQSRYGEFLSCQNYSKDDDGCKYKASIDLDGNPIKQKEKEYCKDWKCPECGSKLVKRKSKVAEFWGCEGYSKGCFGKRDLEGEVLEFKTKKSAKKSFRRKGSKNGD